MTLSWELCLDWAEGIPTHGRKLGAEHSLCPPWDFWARHSWILASVPQFIILCAFFLRWLIRMRLIVLSRPLGQKCLSLCLALSNVKRYVVKMCCLTCSYIRFYFPHVVNSIWKRLQSFPMDRSYLLGLSYVCKPPPLPGSLRQVQPGGPWLQELPESQLLSPRFLEFTNRLIEG